MPWSHVGYVIPISSYPLLPTKPLRAPRHCHSYLSCTDLDVTFHTSALAFSGEVVLRIAYKPSPIKQNAWAQAYKNYLQINAFPNLVVVEREGGSHALQKKATGRAVVSDERDGWLDAAKPDSWDVNISFYRAFSVWWRPAFPVWRRPVFPVWWRRQKVEGLDVTLDDPADVRRWILVNGWMWVRDSSERWITSWTTCTSEEIVWLIRWYGRNNHLNNFQTR